MLKRIEVLGHLILHTRQLDVIMANADHVEYYRTKLQRDIESILTTCADPDDLSLEVCPSPGAEDSSVSPPTAVS